MTHGHQHVQTKAHEDAIAYYKSLRDRFSLWNAEGTSPMPGQVLFNKETNAFWGPITCKEQNVDFKLFRDGQLEYRLANDNADY